MYSIMYMNFFLSSGHFFENLVKNNDSRRMKKKDYKDANTKRGDEIEIHNSIHNIQKIVIMQCKNMV